MERSIVSYMNPNPLSMDRNATLRDVFNFIYETRVSHVLITKGKRLVGIISKEDLLNRMLALVGSTSGKTYSSFKLDSILAKDIMTIDLITAKPDSPLEFAVECLLQKKFHSLPIVNDNFEPVGIVTPYDLLKGYYQEVG